ncbi:MAG: DinB family protein [Candidatus Kapabacteria bacterium]|jgi:uncharacterized damage-inducible protein DinB|nr:DinB family protein [Candidatus Kapabacteria bacterium]
MYHSINEFLVDWEKEKDCTLKIFEALTNESLKSKVYDEGRTLGFLGWHITNTVGEMMSKTGLDIKELYDANEEPESVQQIISEYQRLSTEMENSLKDKWTDETLNQDFNMYGQTWKGVDVLESLIKHQIHHRAQMTVLMRQADLKVPGIYGPSKDDWALYGMPAHK